MPLINQVHMRAQLMSAYPELGSVLRPLPRLTGFETRQTLDSVRTGRARIHKREERGDIEWRANIVKWAEGIPDVRIRIPGGRVVEVEYSSKWSSGAYPYNFSAIFLLSGIQGVIACSPPLVENRHGKIILRFPMVNDLEAKLREHSDIPNFRFQPIPGEISMRGINRGHFNGVRHVGFPKGPVEFNDVLSPDAKKFMIHPSLFTLHDIYHAACLVRLVTPARLAACKIFDILEPHQESPFGERVSLCLKGLIDLEWSREPFSTFLDKTLHPILPSESDDSTHQSWFYKVTDQMTAKIPRQAQRGFINFLAKYREID